MVSHKLIRLAYQKFSKTRKFHSTPERTSNWRDLIKKEFESGKLGTSNQSSDPVCIYRVPSSILQVEPKAYRPNNISIGPFHYGAPHLQNMEMLKRKFFCRLFDPKGANGAKLEEALKFLEEQQVNARRCYMGEIKLSSDEFLHMMLVDGSFIVQLLRDLSKCEFGQVPYLSRWMLPVMRRELIMLENQLPMFVLSKLFELTDNTQANSEPGTGLNLKALALRFFYPLLQVDSEKIPECEEKGDELRGHHFLDLLRSSLRPKLKGGKPRGVQHHMIRSVTELKEAGVNIIADETRKLLDISFGRKWEVIMTELKIPPLYINDHRGTVFRNIMAFENCHKECNPDVTTYLFFFNGLIHSAEDVALLHYKGVLHHSLGNDYAVSELINKISEGVALDKNESYLHEVVNAANAYFGSSYARKRATLVHYYFTSWMVGISTIGAVLALYFTVIQALCGIADKSKPPNNYHFGPLLLQALGFPFHGIPSDDSKGGHDSECEDWSKEFQDVYGYFSQ